MNYCEYVEYLMETFGMKESDAEKEACIYFGIYEE